VRRKSPRRCKGKELPDAGLAGAPTARKSGAAALAGRPIFWPEGVSDAQNEVQSSAPADAVAMGVAIGLTGET
jgi:hypothetical protein